MSLVYIARRILHYNKICQVVSYHIVKLSSKNAFYKVGYENNSIGCRYLSYSYQLNRELPNETKKNTGEAKPQKKKKEKLIYITLIENDKVTVLTLEDAVKLSKRRNLKLVQIKDYETKTERATYQLMSAADILADEKKSKTQKKDRTESTGVKLLSISSKIEEHDLTSKTKNIMKWLTKKNEVRISISNDDNKGEDVFKRISEKIEGNGRIVQKRLSNNALKFQILPMKQSEETGESEKSS